LSRAPKGASARVRSSCPLAGAPWASLVRRSFISGPPMGRRHVSATIQRSDFLPPIDAGEWQTIAREIHLTPQQSRVVWLILHGKRDKQIAAELGLSVRTVREHLKIMFERLGVDGRVELVLLVFAMFRGGGEERSRHRRK
jgi:DNA-binding NarL/FixJ family response regulator